MSSAAIKVVAVPANGSNTRVVESRLDRAMIDLTHSAENPALYRNHLWTGSRMLSTKVQERCSTCYKPQVQASIKEWRSLCNLPPAERDGQDRADSAHRSFLPPGPEECLTNQLKAVCSIAFPPPRELLKACFWLASAKLRVFDIF